MLARLCCFGLYIMPCVPNTIQVLQQTYQNYGLFKSIYCKNIQTLLDYRFARKKTLSMVYIPLLVFGGVFFNGVMLPDTLTEIITVEINLSVWQKFGVVPLPQACLYAPFVVQQVVTHENGVIGMTNQPITAQGTALEFYNNLCCNILLSELFDGNQIRLEFPKIKVSATVVTT